MNTRIAGSASIPDRSDRLRKLFTSIENGKFFMPVQASVAVIVLLIAVVSGIDIYNDDETFSSPRSRHYFIKRVSTVPLNQRNESADASADNQKTDDLTAEDIRRRYVNYVIAKIEQNKIYPISEQKLGHEGTVTVQLYIEKGGGLRKAIILRQARYVKLTKSAIESIRRSIPFTPFPSGLPDDEIILNLNIEYYLE